MSSLGLLRRKRRPAHTCEVWQGPMGFLWSNEPPADIISKFTRCPLPVAVHNYRFPGESPEQMACYCIDHLDLFIRIWQTHKPLSPEAYREALNSQAPPSDH